MDVLYCLQLDTSGTVFILDVCWTVSHAGPYRE